LLFFGLIERVGPTKTLTVTFLAPVFGIIWGVIFLSEPLTLSTLIGFAIILTGTAFVTGFSLKRLK
jgi:drug/metabolite transporter (DMT)-like permease